LREVAGPAVRAIAAGDRRRNHDAVAGLEVAHLLADLFHGADRLVAEDRARPHPRQGAADHAQVGAADGAGGDADEGVGRVLEAGLAHLVQADVVDAVKHDGFHEQPPPVPLARGAAEAAISPG
jgi:hypothetical protein